MNLFILHPSSFILSLTESPHMLRIWCLALPICVGFILVVLVPAPAQGGKKYALKTTDAQPPKELSDAIQKLIAPGSVQLTDAAGKVICDVWFRKEVPEAPPEKLRWA